MPRVRSSVTRLLTGSAVLAVLCLRAAPSLGFLLSTASNSQRLRRPSLRRATEDATMVKFDSQGAKAAVDVEAVKEDKDDGKVLDTSSLTGWVGAIVVSIAILPYIAVVLYSAWTLVTTGTSIEQITLAKGSAVALAPNGMLGIAEVLGYTTVFGMVLWSLVSFITRFRGLPPGLDYVQNLSYLTVVVVLAATSLDGLGADNPLRGISFGSSQTELQTAAAKAKTLAEKTGNQAAQQTKKIVEKETSELLAATAAPRSVLDTKLKDVGAQINSQTKVVTDKINTQSKELSDKISSKVKVPDIKLPDVKLPDVKLPDVKPPASKPAETKAEEFSLKSLIPDMGKPPETKAPEVKAPDPKPAGAKPAETKPAETKPPEPTKPAEAPKKAVEPTKPAEAPKKAVEPTKPAEAPKKAVDINDLFD